MFISFLLQMLFKFTNELKGICNGDDMKELLIYLKSLPRLEKTALILILLLYILEMLWSLLGNRIYFNYVPVKSIYDFYILFFPFAFLFINFICTVKQCLNPFVIAIDLILEFTYPPFLLLICLLFS